MLNFWNSYRRLCFKNFPQPWSKLIETKFEDPVCSRNDSVFQLQILSLTHQNQCWIWPSFFLEVQNFPKNIWGFWGRGVFSRKKRFSILPVGYGHSCKKYVFDICLYRARLDFAFYYFLALKFIENLHKL